MGKLIRLGATALSMIGILVMILCVQAAMCCPTSWQWKS